MILSGGRRIIEATDQNKQVLVDSDSKPITEKVVMPKIEGAIILAEGRRQCRHKNKYYSSSSCGYRFSNS